MSVKIKQNGMEVLCSGSVIVSKGYETTVTFEDEFVIKIVFGEEKEQVIEKKQIYHGLELVLKGFDNSLGTCTTSPMPIAKRNDKIVYVSLCVHCINDVKLLSYTFLCEV